MKCRCGSTKLEQTTEPKIDKTIIGKISTSYLKCRSCLTEYKACDLYDTMYNVWKPIVSIEHNSEE